MVAQTKRYARTIGGQAARAAGIGRCLSCGFEVSRCAVPFSAELTCCKCHTVNVYEDSRQPTKIRENTVAIPTKLAYRVQHDQEHLTDPRGPEACSDQ